MIVLERRWSDFSTRRYQIVSSCSVLVDAPIEATSTVESGGPEAVQRVQRGRVIKNHRRRREKWDLGGSPLRTVKRREKIRHRDRAAGRARAPESYE